MQTQYRQIIRLERRGIANLMRHSLIIIILERLSNE
jgi:hypothetical protein